MTTELDRIQYWLSYGGGVNSTALAILMIHGRFPEYEPWRIIFSDTGCEKDETYQFIREHFVPYLEKHGRILEITFPKETVIERWERLSVTGSRILRTCTVEAKIKPQERYVKFFGKNSKPLIGIDAGEQHRQRESIRPLVDADIWREDCIRIIKDAGLPVPIKSGCWCRPFARVGEVIKLIKEHPCRFARIERLEKAATEKHGAIAETGEPRTQWGDRPCSYWRERASQGDLFYDGYTLVEDMIPCSCYD